MCVLDVLCFFWVDRQVRFSTDSDGRISGGQGRSGRPLFRRAGELEPHADSGAEGNNAEGPRSATPLEWTSTSASQEGVICALTEDWYLIDAPSGQHTFRLSTPEGDLDLFVYSATDQQLINSGETTSSEEVVEINLDSPTQLYLRVDGFFNERGPYTLSWE